MQRTVELFQVQVIFQHYAISNLEKYFPRSDEFLPERWLKSCPFDHQSVDIERNHHPFASLPFGYGRRMCLGRRLADLEIQTVISKVQGTIRYLVATIPNYVYL